MRKSCLRWVLHSPILPPASPQHEFVSTDCILWCGRKANKKLIKNIFIYLLVRRWGWWGYSPHQWGSLNPHLLFFWCVSEERKRARLGQERGWDPSPTMPCPALPSLPLLSPDLTWCGPGPLVTGVQSCWLFAVVAPKWSMQHTIYSSVTPFTTAECTLCHQKEHL